MKHLLLSVLLLLLAAPCRAQNLTLSSAVDTILQSASKQAFATAAVDGVTINPSTIGATSPGSLAATTGTFSGSVSAAALITTASGDGATLLTFATERAWAWKQTGTGAGAGLVLSDLTGGKSFNIDTTGNIGFGVATPLTQGHFGGTSIIVAGSRTPASAAALGTTGTLCWDADYIYICTATNTWKRVAVSTW